MLSFITKCLITLLHAAVLVLLTGVIVLATSLVWRMLALILLIYFLYLFLIKLLRITFCICTRVSFCRRLRRWVKSKGLSYKRRHMFFVPFFSSYTGADITLGQGEEAIHLKFFPFVTHKEVVHVVNRRHLVFSNSWGLPLIRTSYDKAGNPLTDHLFQRAEKAQLYFAPDEKNGIWLIPPKVHRLTVNRTVGVCTVRNGYEYKNGEHFYEYKACLRMLAKKI